MLSYDDRVLDQLRIDSHVQASSQEVTSNTRQFTIDITIPDEENTRRLLNFSQLVVFPASMDIREMIRLFVENREKLYGKKLLVKYKNIVFSSGTIQDCNIENDTVVELISPPQEELANKNEGFCHSYWSVVPLVFSLSFVIAGLIGRFDMIIRACYVIFGTVIGVPSLVLLALGMHERFPDVLKTGFVERFWLSPTIECFSCFFGNKETCDDDELSILV